MTKILHIKEYEYYSQTLLSMRSRVDFEVNNKMIKMFEST